MNIGKLERIDPRDLWKGEASDFTPWLALEDNIERLSETIGLDLEVISEEKNVGPFRADILCKSTVDETYVLIENQLERTDHLHLGQLITYAAGLEAVNIVWIAKRFSEEHRAALDWLNRVTDERLRFFGIELEVYKIGDSLPAPMFQLISKPNDWTKAVHSASKQRDLTETKALYLEYWTAMKNFFEEAGTKLSCQKPLAQHWTNFAIGKSGFHLAAVASSRDNFIRVEFIMNSEHAKSQFDQLEKDYKEESYQHFGSDFIWDRMNEKKMSWVYLSKPAKVSDKKDWPNQFDWIKNKLEKLDFFFRPKIKLLK